MKNIKLKLLKEKIKKNSIKDYSWIKDSEYRQKNMFWLDKAVKIAIKILIEKRSKNITTEQLSKGTKIKMGLLI